jgi:DNA-directed RNA polymerase specialized sigma subunit
MADRNIADLPFETIASAVANDLDATTAVIAATESRILYRAGQHATIGGRYDADLAEDMAQIGRVAVWTNLPNFTGSTSAQFFVYMDRWIDRAMAEQRRQETALGVSREAARRFEDALVKAKGDQFEAEHIAADKTVMGKHALSAESAFAARLAWQGSISLDAPLSEDGGTLGDLVASEMGIPGDMVTSRDVADHKRAATKRAVHTALGKLSARMSGVLKRDYSFDGVVHYAGKPGESDAEMSAEMGITPAQIQQARNKGKDRFREVYLAGSFGELAAV